MIHFFNKKLGETPLEAVERLRDRDSELRDLPMTYAGRLDPLAEGVLLILSGADCKMKEKYSEFDKEYEVSVLFGVKTDSYDLLGMPEVLVGEHDNGHMVERAQTLEIKKYEGTFEQDYPPFSSKTVGGKPLHELARNGKLPAIMPKKEVNIYFIEKKGETAINGKELLLHIKEVAGSVKGDFRQPEIVAKWTEVLRGKESVIFPIISIKVKCSSGTYMRSLAQNMGKDADLGALAFSIVRTRIFTVEGEVLR
ncbi:MAG: hypothetical protein WCV79_03300 [Candidatus Paceibacterota bacterium]|jgi:tRNA pseudouridine55 synthase